MPFLCKQISEVLNETNTNHLAAGSTHLYRGRRSTRRKKRRSGGPGVDLKAADGTILKASYFAAARPGPGVLLLHQSNRTRDSWDGVAGQLAAAGINTLTLDMRGFGESGGTPNINLTDAERAKVHRPGLATLRQRFNT